MKKQLFLLALMSLMLGLNAQTILNEGFENGFPQGWTMFNDNNTVPSDQDNWHDSAWEIIDGLGNNSNCAITTTSYFEPAATADRWLITPALAIPAGSTGNCITFEASSYYMWYDDIEVRVCTTAPNSRADFGAPLLSVHEVPLQYTEYMVNLDAYAGQTIYVAFICNSYDGYILMVDNVWAGQRTTSEMMLSRAKVPGYVSLGTPFQVGGIVVNRGSSALTEFDVQYVIEGFDTVSEHISGLNLAYNESARFNCTTPNTIATAGTYQVTVIVSNPNGDADNMDDNVASTSFIAYEGATAFERTSLLEHFTTGKCVNCPRAHDMIHSLLENRDDIIWMTHHAGYYTDEMTTTDDETLTWFYNKPVNGGTYAPAAMIDRRPFEGCDIESPVFFPESSEMVEGLFDQAVDIPAFANVEISNLAFNQESRELTFSLNVTNNATLANPRLYVYLVQDSIIAYQTTSQGGDQNYRHDNVYRAPMLGDVWGQQINIVEPSDTENTETYQVSYTIPAKYKDVAAAGRFRVVAFVANYNSADMTDCVIENATKSEDFFVNAPAVGIAEAGALSVSLYPNPATDYVVLQGSDQMQEVTIVNTLGQVVYTRSQVNSNELVVNTRDLASGLYIATVRTANGTSAQRFTVAR